MSKKKSEIFGANQLLAVASIIARNATDTGKTFNTRDDASAIVTTDIAKQSLVIFIKLCAETILSTTPFAVIPEREQNDFDDIRKQLKILVKQTIAQSDVDSPVAAAFVLISIYERLLPYQLIPDPSSESAWCLESAKQNRRKQGQYYTPLHLTEQAVKTALEELFTSQTKILDRSLNEEDVARLRIVDPAMGAGSFLVCALDFFVEYIEKLHKTIDDPQNANRLKTLANNCLYGVDLDAVAPEVACIVVSLYCSIKSKSQFLIDLPGLHCHLRSGNSLISFWSYYQTRGQTPALSKEQQDDFCLNTMFDESAIVDKLKAMPPNAVPSLLNFFHWQSEFPEIFSQSFRTGFDAVLSNPPWEAIKPNTREFFAEHVDDYRAINRPDALVSKERILAESSSVRASWDFESEFFKGFNRYLKQVQELATESKNENGVDVPFKIQGKSDLNVYKLFVELSYCLLAENGCMSLIVPSGIFTDKGATALREHFLSEAEIFEIRSFLNRDQTFAIHPSFNYCVFSVQKRKLTTSSKLSAATRVSFGNLDSSTKDLKTASFVSYQRADVHLFAPMWKTFLEVESANDLPILRKIYDNAGTLSELFHTGDGLSSDFSFLREFDLTNDAHAFIPRARAILDKFICDQYGNWLKGNWQKADEKAKLCVCENQILSQDGLSIIKINSVSDVLLPVYEGRMLGLFDYSQKSHFEGTGRSAVWQNNSVYEDSFFNNRIVQPQYFLPLKYARERTMPGQLKVGYLAVGAASNARTMIASTLYSVPCGNSVPVFKASFGHVHQVLALTVCLNSFVFDYVLRLKMSGNNINFYLLQDCPMPDLKKLAANKSAMLLAALLSFNHCRYARSWLNLSKLQPHLPVPEVALNSTQRRIAQAALDAVVANLFALDTDEYAWILKGCDQMAGKTMKGFWRVDKLLPPDERQSNLALKYFLRLKEVGEQSFCDEILEQIGPRLCEGQPQETEYSRLEILARNLDSLLALKL